jgi:ribonucleoside-triphosphate reductase (thioredoxin)
MNNARKMMADAKFYESYSRYQDNTGKYETWEESVDRVMNMHKTKYKDKLNPELIGLMEEVSQGYKNKLLLGAQRALQFGGDQLLKQNARLYNCSVTYCDRVDAFKESMYMLLCGSGVGFSVQTQHISKLPPFNKKLNPSKTIYQIEDSIEGWSDSVGVLLDSYMTPESTYFGKDIVFDYSLIRSKGSFISGGFKAPGSEPLRKALELVGQLIETTLAEGHTVVRTIVAYDIMMYLADAVISGGVRRAATICMFSKGDEDMLNAKTGDWWIKAPQRGRSNNSVMLLRSETTKEEFSHIMKSVKDVGEPGFIFTDNLEYLFNPCVEIGMKPVTKDGKSGFQVCNLSEISGVKSTTKEIFFEQCKYAAIIGTLQAGYTDFNYLASFTKDIVEREALIGVGITGVMNNPQILTNKQIQEEGAEIVKKWNEITAKLIGINPAARTTCIKPAGNSSVLLECASGIHGEHSPKFLRHVQFNKETEIAQAFLKYNPDMCQDSVWGGTDIVVAFPIVAPEQSVFKKDLLGVKQLEHVKNTQTAWIEAGTNKHLGVDPIIRHNVSNTITVDDWVEVEDYIYNNRQSLCGVSLLAAAGDKAYPQAPFTEILTYEEIVGLYGEVSLFTSALIEIGLEAFNNDLWNAIATALGFGESLTEGHEDLLKRDFVRRFKKFSINFRTPEDCSNCLKDVYNLHKWWKINANIKQINWSTELSKKTFVDVDTMAAQACHGSNCEIS